ncbi:MAG: alpha/beta fold hydrolase [Proteobacteria bacterium]|nr:alpha/beta fold hydrolase [Pseudomonadota bacterium]HQR03207.1 alpha/beta hydrolase [Rhodocyclaceae bacterium]
METAQSVLPEGRYVDIGNGLKIHYLEEGQGPVVVFLHGSASGASAYSNFKLNYPELVAAGYRVVLPDLVGYGFSSKPENAEYTLDFFVDCLHKTLKTIGVTRYSLLGNSLGGAVALQYTLSYPEHVEKLIIMAPGGVEDQPDYFKMPGMQAMREIFGAGPMTPDKLRMFMENYMVFDKSVVTDRLIEERMAIMKLMNPQVIKTMKVPNLESRLGEIKCPVLAFWGMNENMMPETGIMKLAKKIIDIRMVLISRCGHWVMAEHRDMFNRTCVDFLKYGNS